MFMIRKFLFPILFIVLFSITNGCSLIAHWNDSSSSSASSSSIAVTNITVVTNSLTTTTNTFSIGDTNFMVINSTNILGTNIVLSSVYDTTNISAKCWVSNWIVLSNTITNLWCNITNASFKNSSLIYSTTNNFYFTNWIALTNCPNAYTVAWVTTIAGSASFSQPYGIALDSSGNIYVADSDNSIIYKINPSGIVTTFAGANAYLSCPVGMAVDSSGNVYVADYGNNRICKFTSEGAMTTLPGTFNYPYDVAVDSSGNVYVADTGYSRIQKIDSLLSVSTFATGLDPYGIALDSSGNLYVADADNQVIDKITTGGVKSTFSDSTMYSCPQGVAVDSSNNVYVLDCDKNQIYKISPAGVLTILAGSGNAGSADGAGATASFNYPSGIALDSSGNLYVADTGNNKIRKIFTP